MITIRLSGGLGNQMFQYAAGKSLAQTQETQFKLDLSFFKLKGYTKRNFELSNFNIQAELATEQEMTKYQTPLWLNKINQIFKSSLGKPRGYFSEKKVSFDKDFLMLPKDSYIDGVWMSEKYFLNIRNELIGDFTIPPQNQTTTYKNWLNKITSTKNPVSLHVRRGDYVKFPKITQLYGICSPEYYNKAINLIKKKNNDNITIFVFSDDIEWCKQNLNLNTTTFFVSDTTGFEDIILMSNCSGNIIANSTFSWWGAWLNQSPNKTVIAPWPWFDKKNIETKDILPNNWIKIGKTNGITINL